jgi:hypothetical protein
MRRPAIVYTRVFPEHEGELRLDTDAQKAWIRSFARAEGFSLKDCFHDSAPENAHKRPDWTAAKRLSRQRSWPIIVASLDRISQVIGRAADADVEELFAKVGLVIISARAGELMSRVTVPGEGARAEARSELRSRLTKVGIANAKSIAKAKAIAEGKSPPKSLRDPVNLRQSAKKGAQRNQLIGKLRLAEFEQAVAEARREDCSTATEIAKWLNDNHFATASGAKWTPDNVSSFLGKSRKSAKAAKVAMAVAAAVVLPAPSIAGPDRILTSDGVERVRKARQAGGFHASATGKFMAHLGFSNYDVSVDFTGRVPIRAEKLFVIERFVAEMEARTP